LAITRHKIYKSKKRIHVNYFSNSNNNGNNPNYSYAEISSLDYDMDINGIYDEPGGRKNEWFKASID
jgi:hypothetical protein